LSVVGSVIFQRLAADDVVGSGFDELRDQSVESFGILFVSQVIALQGAGEARKGSTKKSFNPQTPNFREDPDSKFQLPALSLN
jgi:hypothetical protein